MAKVFRHQLAVSADGLPPLPIQVSALRRSGIISQASDLFTPTRGLTTLPSTIRSLPESSEEFGVTSVQASVVSGSPLLSQSSVGLPRRSLPYEVFQTRTVQHSQQPSPSLT